MYLVKYSDQWNEGKNDKIKQREQMTEWDLMSWAWIAQTTFEIHRISMWCKPGMTVHCSLFSAIVLFNPFINSHVHRVRCYIFVSCNTFFAILSLAISPLSRLIMNVKCISVQFFEAVTFNIHIRFEFRIISVYLFSFHRFNSLFHNSQPNIINYFERFSDLSIFPRIKRKYIL